MKRNYGDFKMELKSNGVSTRRKVGSIIVLLLCAAIAAIVASVFFFVYKPDQNRLGALASVCMDGISIILMLILIVTLLFEKVEMNKSTKLFMMLMLGTLVALFLDFLTWSLDGKLGYGGWTYAFTVSSLCMGSVLAFIFVSYISYYMVEMYELEASLTHARVCRICNIVAFIVTLILALTKTAFTFENGHYQVGALYDIVTVFPILSLLYMSAYAFIKRKVIGAHDLIAILCYILIMIAGALIEADYAIGTTYVSVTLADLFIFVMLQNNVISVQKKNVEKWKMKSNIDDMTGFFNRFAYENEIALLGQSGISEDFAYVSMDVNSLKVINDERGHNAGDELIIGACECMKQCLGPYGKLYRTGGDEFVALIYADETILTKIKSDLKEVTANWKGELNSQVTISCGFVNAKEAKDMTLHQIAVLADKRMYEDKAKFYRKKGVDRRGQRDAHVALFALYTKILKANITDDTYQIVDMKIDEQAKEKGFDKKLSVWMSEFGKRGQVHPDDLSEYLEKTSNEYISDYFKNNQLPLRIFYRRKFDDVYKQVMLEMIKSNEYTDESQSIFLYVKEIEK